jgi:exopolysaccharide biosynthesis WecB/TagA/CpsF family protein
VGGEERSAAGATVGNIDTMKILLCHNYYQHPGGEDQVFADERQLLQSRGHTVVSFTLHNDCIRQLGDWKTARCAIWNSESYASLRALIRRERPDLLHCTNLFPLISPAAYYAAHREGVPVVQSLHNYRWLCPNGLLFRSGRPCEDCLGKPTAWPAVLHGCYRDSRLGSAVVAAAQAVHHFQGTWTSMIDRYVVPSHFARRKFVEGGLPPEKLAVKPNFVYPDPGPADGQGGYAIFVGRLSSEKGIDLLVAAWQLLRTPTPLKVVGEGPLADRLSRACKDDPRICRLGRLRVDQVSHLLGEAACLVFPSLCYETFGRAIVESFAKGTPVIVPRLGAMAELVDDGRTGRYFEPGNPAALANTVEELVSAPLALARMRHEARREYERKFSADRNYRLLMAVYRQALSDRRGTRAARGPACGCPLAGGGGKPAHGPRQLRAVRKGTHRPVLSATGRTPPNRYGADQLDQQQAASSHEGDSNGPCWPSSGAAALEKRIVAGDSSRRLRSAGQSPAFPRNRRLESPPTVIPLQSELVSEIELRWPRKKELFGVGVSIATCEEVVEVILHAARRRASAVVSLHPVHGVVTASGDAALREATNRFEIVVPDGQPVRWALNLLHRAGLRDRVAGAHLVSRLCRRAAEEGVPVYLYGSTPAVLESLQANLRTRFPKLSIAGAQSPPFRRLTPEEDEAAVGRINASGAGIVLVGLGYPKQDYFALEHRHRVQSVMVCVGAVFDFHSGHKTRAPVWMQRHGLEWFYRLIQEPRRLWRRYLITNTVFLVKLTIALLASPWRPKSAGASHKP